MNSARDTRAACEKKHIYTGMSQARKVARAMHERFGEVFAPYRCVRCNGFHIGHHGNLKKPMKVR